MTAVWRAFLLSSLALLAALSLSVPFVEAGTATGVITLLSFGMLAVMAVGSAAFVYLDWDPFEGLALDT